MGFLPPGGADALAKATDLIVSKGWIQPAVIIAAVLYVAALLPKRALKGAGNEAVIISGCDSGFGRGVAKALAYRGYTVFAGCFTSDGLAAWEADIELHREGMEPRYASGKEIPNPNSDMADPRRRRIRDFNVIPFHLDITQAVSIGAAHMRISRWLNELGPDGRPVQPKRRIFALVNNAGVPASGLVDWAPLQSYHSTMAVNFFGHVAMTKAFLHAFLVPGPWNAPRRPKIASLLRALAAPLLALPLALLELLAWLLGMTLPSADAAPRIVNVASIAGILGAPGLSAYCASKFAIEGFADSLRRELKVWGVPVVLIEPSFLNTPILAGTHERAHAQWAALPRETRERWGDTYFQEALRQASAITAAAESAQKGVDAIVAAVTAPNPWARYRAGTEGRYILPWLALMPVWAADFIVSNFGGSATLPAGVLLGAASGAGIEKTALVHAREAADAAAAGVDDAAADAGNEGRKEAKTPATPGRAAAAAAAGKAAGGGASATPGSVRSRAKRAGSVSAH